MRGHMGSGVTEANCSEAGVPRSDSVGGFISATRANNTHSDPHTRTPTPWTVIQSIPIAGCCRLGVDEAQKHTHLHAAGSNGGKNFVKQTIFKGSGCKCGRHNVTARVKCARAGRQWACQ